ncbi:MAG TPA: GNAT family N-acetyltransferase [Planococcus sp. (in: firmicutes)]|nr:GNAT family N-acetyltransferase [Planococcus sp. (in: firmicutes)]
MYELVFSSQTNRWQHILDLFNLKDIYYTREYLVSALKLDPGEAMLFYYIDEDGHGETVYPFIKRQLMSEGSLFYDITSPFGYGGPVLKVRNDGYKLASNFLRIFEDFCKAEKIIAEYIRFHPVLNNAEFFIKQLDLITVYDTYTLQLNAYMSEAEQTTAERADSGLIFKKLGTVKNMFDFLVLYYSTIRKREETDSYYFFTNDYFESLVSALGPELHLFGAYKDHKLLTASYVLTKGETIYHHLSGKSEDADLLEAEAVLLNNIAEWGAYNGFRYFHLAGKQPGSLTAEVEDSNKPYAVSSSTFFIARLVHDPEIYISTHPIEQTELIKRYGNV